MHCVADACQTISLRRQRRSLLLALAVFVAAVAATGFASARVAGATPGGGVVPGPTTRLEPVVARRNTASVRDVIYADYAPGLEVLDIWPAANSDSPIVILVHGGGWYEYDKSSLDPEAKYLNSQGFSVFNIDYRLATETSTAFPMEVEDVELATRWALKRAREYNGNVEDVVLIGASAGGQLVGLAAEEMDAVSRNTVNAVATLSAPTDFVSLAQDQDAGKLSPTIIGDAFIALGCNLSACTDALETQWSPAKQVTTSNCPRSWLIINSESELVPIDQLTSMTSALKHHQCKVKRDILRGKLHAMDYWNTVKTTVAAFVKAAA